VQTKRRVLQGAFKFREGEVSRIRFGCRSHTPTHGVELPHQPGIAMPSLGRGDLLDPIIPPHSSHATECWDAAFRAYSCSGENEDAVGGGNGEHQLEFVEVREVQDFSRHVGNMICSPASCGVKRFNSSVHALHLSEAPVRKSAGEGG
jgi:hypothetical protein